MKHWVVIFLLVTIYFITGCNDDDSNPVLPKEYSRGDISEIKLIGSSTKENIQQILSGIQFNVPFTLSNSVKTLSINYYTIDGEGNQELASGALFIPDNLNNLPSISIQHGTETFSSSVASVSSLSSVEGLSGLMLASMGYVVFVPDYLGFGVSNVSHPYMHAKSLTPCIIDFIRAGRKHISNENISLNGKLFLSGYSEGGYLTLATQKDIEENYYNEFNLTAVAPMAGPYDLRGTADSIFVKQEYSDPIYIGYLLSAYNKIYNLNKLNEMFRSPYSTTVTSLFDGSKTWREVGSQLPSELNDLIKSDFISNYLSGAELELTNAFDENTLVNWTPKTPIHFFHGDADEIVPVENVLKTIEVFESRGVTNIELTTIPGGTHATAGPEAIIAAIEWIENFR